MASGVIDGFFRRPRAGQPLRALANVDNLNRVANILNDISGEGCAIDKPLNGDPWIVRRDGTHTDNVPTGSAQTEAALTIYADNQAEYVAASDIIRPVDIDISVNGIAVSIFASLEYWWQNTDGVKYLYIYQHYYTSSIDANGQYTGNPDYIYTSQELDANDPNFTLVSKIPYCRVAAGDPPEITCLLEGPLQLYCYRGDADTKAYAPTPIEPAKQIQTSKTIDNDGAGALPIKVRNLDAASDGFYDEYPNGRWRTEQGELIENAPDATAKAKNDAKAVLMRYKADNANGVPRWCNISQFKTASASWVEDFIYDELESNVPGWLIDILEPIAWEIWNTNKGPFAPRCPDEIGGNQVVAAIMGKGGWVSIYDIVVGDGELAAPGSEYATQKARADQIAISISNAQQAIAYATTVVANAQAALSALPDHSADVAGYTAEAAQEATDAATMASDFSALDARISALEQRQ